MNVHIVTQGSYSDYRIVAVYDEAHQACAITHAKFIGGEVECWPLNEALPLKDGLAPYSVWYEVNGNASANAFPLEWSDDIKKVDADYWLLYVYADSPQHAAKIAMERVTQEKALHPEVEETIEDYLP